MQVDNGDLFYPIDNSWWSPSSNLFPNSPTTKAAFDNLEPFPVFSTWNGMAVLSPTPFTKPYNTRFRRGNLAKGECAASECTLVCSDFWKAGWGRVQVVPSVQVCCASL
jgi:alpha-1,3-mannosyltransferase